MSTADERTPRQNLEAMGPDKVRHMLATAGLPQSYVREAVDFLAEFDAAERERNDSSQSSQFRTALSAKNAAWIAAIAAIAAAIIAIVGIILTYLSWMYPKK